MSIAFGISIFIIQIESHDGSVFTRLRYHRASGTSSSEEMNNEQDEVGLLSESSKLSRSAVERERRELEETLKAELECPICLDPFENPYINPECGHRFSYQCIQQAINKSGKECPLCRVKITY